MNKLYIVQICAVLCVCGCSEHKMPLPTPAVSAFSFGANDTSYVELKPVWDSSFLGISLNAPGDMAISADGTLFLADESANRIHLLSKAGVAITDFDGRDFDAVVKPRALAMDSKLNLLVVNGTHQLYIWNQYLNRVRIDSVADSGVYFDPAKNETIQLSFAELRQRVASGGSVPILRRYFFRSDPAAVASARKMRLAYQDADAAAQFSGVAAGKYGEETVYLTDSRSDRIVQLLLVPELAFKGEHRTILYQYSAAMQKTVAVYGSGSGTVDDPWAIATDTDENIYFTQLAGNFRVQRLNAGTFTPRYVLYQHAIMDLERFEAPYDVALDETGNIFVLDGGTGLVSKYANKGARAGQLLSLGQKGLATAIFREGRGLLVSDNVVYVVEQSARCVRRFQYSVSDADIPDDDKKP